MSRIVDTIRRPAGEQPHPRPIRTAAPDGGARSQLGVVQYFHKDDRDAVERALEALDGLPVHSLRTSISWCDWTRPGGEQWYAWLLPKLLERAPVLPCFLYTPPELGILPKTSSPPRDPQAYGEFVEMVLREHRDAFPHVELWNEPNNYIEWDWTLDPEWGIFAEMIGGAAARVAALGGRSVLGGMSPFDPNWLRLMFERGALENVDVIGVHGFPGTWEAVWDGWSAHIERVREVVEAHGGRQAVWVTEAGYSTWAHDEFGQLSTLVELADAPAERVYWYSLHDLAPERPTLDGFHCDERAYHFGMRRHGGEAKLLDRVLRDRGLSGVREMVDFTASRDGVTLGVRRRRPAVRRQTRSRPRDREPVLITGGAGFIGTNLGDRLAGEGVPVTVLDSLARPGVEENLRWLKRRHGDLVRVELGDIRDVYAVRRAMVGARRVFHLAGQVAVTTSLGRPREDLEVNVQGTINVLEEARQAERPPAIIFTSTNKVYGPLAGLELRRHGDRHEPAAEPIRAHGICELTPLHFSSPYGCSKGAADQYVLDYAHSYGLPTTVLRMSCIYGPHQHGTEDQGWVAHFLLRALRGEPVTVYGDGAQTRDLLHVNDLVDALLVASTNRRALRGEAFNMGGGPANSASVLEVLAMIGELLGEPPEIQWADWRVADQRYYVSDTSRFSELCGWQPRIAPPEGVAALHGWFTGASRSGRRPLLAAAGNR